MVAVAWGLRGGVLLPYSGYWEVASASSKSGRTPLLRQEGLGEAGKQCSSLGPGADGGAAKLDLVAVAPVRASSS